MNETTNPVCENRIVEAEASFSVETRPVARSENVIVGDCYRISVLTSELVRIEYDPEGVTGGVVPRLPADGIHLLQRAVAGLPENAKAGDPI